MADLLISIVSIGVLVITPIIGIFFGVYLAKIYLLKQNRKLEKQAIEVINGERENVLEIDGVKYNATKFKVRGDDGKEVIVAFGPRKKEDKKDLKQQENTYIPPKKFMDKFKFWKRKKPDEEMIEETVAENPLTKTEEPKKAKKEKPKNKPKKSSKIRVSKTHKKK